MGWKAIFGSKQVRPQSYGQLGQTGHSAGAMGGGGGGGAGSPLGGPNWNPGLQQAYTQTNHYAQGITYSSTSGVGGYIVGTAGGTATMYPNPVPDPHHWISLKVPVDWSSRPVRDGERQTIVWRDNEGWVLEIMKPTLRDTSAFTLEEIEAAQKMIEESSK